MTITLSAVSNMHFHTTVFGSGSISHRNPSKRAAWAADENTVPTAVDISSYDPLVLDNKPNHNLFLTMWADAALGGCLWDWNKSLMWLQGNFHPEHSKKSREIDIYLPNLSIMNSTWHKASWFKLSFFLGRLLYQGDNSQSASSVLLVVRRKWRQYRLMLFPMT